MFGIVHIFLFLTQLHGLDNQPAVRIEDGQRGYQLKGKCAYYLDSLDLSFEEVRSLPFVSEYDKSWYDHDGYFWIKFHISNQSTNEGFILTIDQWQEVEFYEVIDSTGWKLTRSGTNIPIWERPIALHRLLSIPINLDQHQSRQYYLKVRVIKPMIQYYSGVYDFLSKIEFETAQPVYRKYIFNQIIIFFVLGSCLSLLIFNSVRIYNKPRWDRIFLFAYILVTSVFIANIHGVATLYMFPFFTAFELQLGVVLVHISTILIALYVRSYIKTSGWEIENVLLWILITAMTFSLIYAAIDQQSHWYYQRRYLEAVILFGSLGIALYRGKKWIWYLIVGFFFALSGRYISEYLANHGGFLLGDIPYLVGFLLQLSLFTIGSSARMNMLEKDIEITLHEKQELLKDQNRKLNEMVVAQTHELREATREISLRNQELEKTINELKNTQEQLVESEKMATIGRITGGLAHELNNPLNIIQGMLDLVKREVSRLCSKFVQNEEEEESISDLDQMFVDLDIATNKAVSVVKNLGNISPSAEFLKNETIQLDELLKDVVNGFREKHPEVLFTEVITSNIELSGCANELHQMLANFIANGIESMSTSSKKEIFISAKIENSQTILSITDTGRGINSDARRLIFEPFYSTKTTEDGIGLGLFVAKTIARKHRAEVDFESQVGLGSTFTVTFSKRAG